MKKLLEMIKKIFAKKEKQVNSKDEALIKLGRAQFTQLMKKGLTIPVVFL